MSSDEGVNIYIKAEAGPVWAPCYNSSDLTFQLANNNRTF